LQISSPSIRPSIRDRKTTGRAANCATQTSIDLIDWSERAWNKGAQRWGGMSAVANDKSQGIKVIQHGAVSWSSIARSHVGAVRALNEDAFLDRPELGIWAVADGMGGHEAGDQASISVVTALAMVQKASNLSELIGDAKTRLRTANESLKAFARQKSVTAGSTVVALLSQGTHIAVIWVGDSRAYLYRQGKLRQLTIDHSRVQQMVDQGLIAPEEADAHPEANLITRAIGASRAIEFDTQVLKAEAGDRYLLCSDGLYRELAPHEIAACLSFDDARLACDCLIAQALEKGGEDNISAIVIRLGNLAIGAGSVVRDPDMERTTIDMTRVGYR
jgi:protein phosphatase